MSLCKKILSMFAALCLLVSLAACGKSPAEDSALLGLYFCVDTVSSGEGVDPFEVFPLGACVELMEKGRCRVSMNGESFSGTWETEGEKLTLTVDGSVTVGSLSKGVMMADLSGRGLVMVLVKDGAEYAPPEETAEPTAEVTPEVTTSPEPTPTEAPVETAAPTATPAPTSKPKPKPTPTPAPTPTPTGNSIDYWNGDWYGWWAVMNATGDWAAYESSYYDCCARIELQEDGCGVVTLWDEDYSADAGMCVVFGGIELDEAYPGTFKSVTGFFMNSLVSDGEWSIDPADAPFDNMLVMNSGHFQGTGGTFDYCLCLRPWGTLWDDVLSKEPGLMPFGYNEWYLPLVRSNSPMPSSFK